MRADNLDIFVSDNFLSEIRAQMQKRYLDQSLNDGDGLVFTMRGRDEPTQGVVVMPSELYEAIRIILLLNPSLVDPISQPQKQDMTQDQFLWFAAFMKLELGISGNETTPEFETGLVDQIGKVLRDMCRLGHAEHGGNGEFRLTEAGRDFFKKNNHL